MAGPDPPAVLTLCCSLSALLTPATALGAKTSVAAARAEAARTSNLLADALGLEEAREG